MAYPAVPVIRVGYMAPRLPYPVNINLPSISEPETRTEPRLVGRQLDIVVPQDPARHEKLGRFLESWGALESSLTILLTYLTGLRLGQAELIFMRLGTKNALDLLNALGQRKLAEDSSNALTNLLERISKMNTKRNILVHGEWVLEANVLLKRGEAVLVTQFLRQTTPIDPADEKAMANPRNQKERVRYCFNLKRIDAATRDTDTVCRDISHFSGSMKRKILSLSELCDELLLSQPYRVKYSKPTANPSPTPANPVTPPAHPGPDGGTAQ
jgi:hypothetical protein